MGTQQQNQLTCRNKEGCRKGNMRKGVVRKDANEVGRADGMLEVGKRKKKNQYRVTD